MFVGVPRQLPLSAHPAFAAHSAPRSAEHGSGVPEQMPFVSCGTPGELLPPASLRSPGGQSSHPNWSANATATPSPMNAVAR